MAQLDGRGDTRDSLSRSVVAALHSYFGNGHPVSNLVLQVLSVKTVEQPAAVSAPPESDGVEGTGSPGKSCSSLNEREDFIHPIDISTVIRSVALMHSALGKLYSLPAFEDNSPPLHPDASTEGAADPAEQEQLNASLQSKYIHIFPLYQDYCLQTRKDDLQRFNARSCESEPITPLHLPALQSRRSSPPCCSEPPTSKQSSPASCSPPAHFLGVIPCTLWQELDEVKAAGLLSCLTPREIRLQESMFELIGSEASYLRSLGVAVNHFYGSKELKRALSQMEHQILFSNITHVKAASQRFLMDLETRLGECVFISQVGDIVLKHCPAFHALYVPYVTNMMYQETLVSQLLQHNRGFVLSVKKLERDPVCQRQSLKSFLVLPFQRITRIKLILGSILKLTKPDSDSVTNLEKAKEAIHEIVTDCDTKVKKMKQIEELVCLEMLLDFGKIKAVPLVVSGRFLVHQGPIRRLTVENTCDARTSLVSVYLHLFNDLLIISSKRDQRFAVEDHAEFPTHVTIEHLKTELLSLPPESFLLHLSKSRTGQPTAMILVPHTRSEKEAWIKLLSSG